MSVPSSPQAFARNQLFTEEQQQLLEAATAEMIERALNESKAKMELMQLELQTLRAAAAAAAPPTNTYSHAIVDTKLGKPPQFRGEESQWATWSFKMRAYMGCLHESYPDVLLRLETMEVRDIEAQLMSDSLSKKLYYVLVMQTEAAALSIVQRIANSDGHEAYRELAKRYNPQTRGRALTRLTAILQADFGNNAKELMDKVTTWERAITDYEAVTGDKVSNAIKMAVLTD